MTLRNLPYPDLLTKELASAQPNNIREGDEVIWQP